MPVWDSLQRRARLRLSRWRFDQFPPVRRVRLDLHTDGRQLSVLMAAIHDAGWGVQLAGGPMLFRELLAFRRYSAMAARVDGAELPCAFSLSDQPLDSSARETMQQLVVDYDVFSPGRSGARLPYGMHPSLYYNGAHRHPWCVEAEEERRIRIGFYGTHDPVFYTRHYAFPGLNRAQILDALVRVYGAQLTPLPAEGRLTFGVSIDQRGGELQPKRFLSQPQYLSALRQTHFVLCLPGWCMPLSHSLIEALYCGAIPITNAHAYMDPPLQHGVEALTFVTLQEFHEVIQQARSMPVAEVARMRAAAARYYRDHLDPRGWWERLTTDRPDRLLVNAEELSTPLMRTASSGSAA